MSDAKFDDSKGLWTIFLEDSTVQYTSRVSYILHCNSYRRTLFAQTPLEPSKHFRDRVVRTNEC